MALASVYITFLAFVAILLIVGSYFISSLLYHKHNDKRIGKRVNLIKQYMSYDAEHGLSEGEVVRLKKLVLSRVGLEAFNKCHRLYIEEHGYDDYILSLVTRVIDFYVLRRNRIVREKYRDSFILYLLAEYRVCSEQALKYAFDSLYSQSLYTRNNALRVIRTSTDAELIVESLKLIGGSKHYFNDKVIIDFTDSFAGDTEELDGLLISRFDDFGQNIQRLLPAHFMNSRNSSQDARDAMLKLLASDDRELVIAASKYFGWVTDERAAPILLENMDHSEWEIRSISARVCQRGYCNEAFLEKLEKRLGDENWYVRQNSAYSYMAVQKDKDAIDRIIHGDDNYARDILFYVMFVKNMIDYDEYQRIDDNNKLEKVKDESVYA